MWIFLQLLCNYLHFLRLTFTTSQLHALHFTFTTSHIVTTSPGFQNTLSKLHKVHHLKWNSRYTVIVCLEDDSTVPHLPLPCVLSLHLSFSLYTYIHIHTYRQTYRHAYICIYMIYVYHTHTRTHTHTHTFFDSKNWAATWQHATAGKRSGTKSTLGSRTRILGTWMWNVLVSEHERSCPPLDSTMVVGKMYCCRIKTSGATLMDETLDVSSKIWKEGGPLCPSRLTKRRTYRPRSVIYRYVSRQGSEKWFKPEYSSYPLSILCGQLNKWYL